jgi:hypothetical protein
MPGNDVTMAVVTVLNDVLQWRVDDDIIGVILMLLMILTIMIIFVAIDSGGFLIFVKRDIITITDVIYVGYSC